jgi:hypothetical protein
MKFSIWVFFEICRKLWSLIKIWLDKRLLFTKTNTHFWSYLAHVFLEWEMFWKSREITCILCSIFLIMPFMRLRGKILQSLRGHRCNSGACALHAGYQRLQTHPHLRQYLLPFHCSSCCTKASQCYAIRTLSISLKTVTKTEVLHFKFFTIGYFRSNIKAPDLFTSYNCEWTSCLCCWWRTAVTPYGVASGRLYLFCCSVGEGRRGTEIL